MRQLLTQYAISSNNAPASGLSATWKDRLRQWLNLIFAGLQFVTPFFAEMTGHGISIDKIDSRYEQGLPEYPATYAFSIWFLIFGLSAVYSVMQVLPGAAIRPVYRRVGFATAGAFLFNNSWMVIAQVYGNGWWLVVLIFGIYFCALLALIRLHEMKEPLTLSDYWFLFPAIGLLSGWLTLAVCLNTSSALRLAFGSFGLSATAFAFCCLMPGALLALAIQAWIKGNFWFTGAVVWGLGAIIVANYAHGPSFPVVSLVLGAIFLLGSREALYQRERARA